MPTSLRTPLELLPPIRNSYSDTYEETRSRIEMEIGVDRVRNVTRSAPQLFSVEFDTTAEGYAVFEKWFETYLKGGERPFDTQLSDNTGLLTWYTVYWIGPYKAEVVDTLNWRITGTLRSIDPPFEYRPSGTDELRGSAKIDVSAVGNLLVQKVLYGFADMVVSAKGFLDAIPTYGGALITLNATGYLEARPLWGAALLEVTATGQLQELGEPELILQFDSVIYTPPDGDDVQLQFDDVEYLPPSIPPP
jgi:hypothetical protein